MEYKVACVHMCRNIDLVKMLHKRWFWFDGLFNRKQYHVLSDVHHYDNSAKNNWLLVSFVHVYVLVTHCWILQDPLEVHSAVSSGDGAAQNGVSLLLPSVVVPTLESADPVVRHPLEVHQPQLVEGRGEGVVSGDDLINFDSITTAMATSAQSQVTIAHIIVRHEFATNEVQIAI